MKDIKRITRSEEGFTIIELMISMGLLTFVMAISMNILALVLEMTSDADYSVVVTQEANFASERVKRVVRSADTFSIAGNTLTVTLEGATTDFTISDDDGDGKFVFEENTNSVMSSEVYAESLQVGGTDVPYFEGILDGTDLVGVRLAFKIYHQNDEDRSSGAWVYTQAVNRNTILE